MRNIVFSVLIMVITAVQASGQLYPETVLGLDVPAQRWSWQTDVAFFGAPYMARFGQACDIASIRFADAEDTTDIILLVNCHQSVLHWVRAEANSNPREVQRFGTYGEDGNEPGQFRNIQSMEVASASDYYDPATDHIYVGDRIRREIIKLNFEFDPSSPQGDTIIWESSVFIDSNFMTIDMEYVDYGTGNINDNRLLVIDDMGSRLAVLSHHGDLLQLFELYGPADSIYHIYTALTQRVLPDGSVVIYMADGNFTYVRRYLYSASGELNYINEINLGDRMQTSLTDVIYSGRFGLWAVESMQSRLYKLAGDLSRVLFEFSTEEFNPRIMFRIQRIFLLPDRLVVFEPMSENTGILSFAFDPPSGKREVSEEEIVPFTFALNQNYPNPFNPNTIMEFEIPSPQWVKLDIFNILGQKVKTLVNQNKNAGHYSIVWDGTNSSGIKVASGVYFSRLSTTDKTDIKKMLLLK